MSDLPSTTPPGAVISLSNVSVRYRVHVGGRRSLKQLIVSLGRRDAPIHDFWALNRVNLSVAPGEVLGIIGRNGAGKSTLLYVVSRVLEPSSGTVVTKGRIAPLLTLGAGFDMELSGRENVYLLGALLGFTKKYIDDCYASIVDFAELWDFIEAPLRTYSSGMLARLGFAIATSSEADLLLVDEVLAVGDEHFRKKCEDRIQQLRDQHVTILLVTHDLPTVLGMCTRAVWLEKGEIAVQGEPHVVVNRYLEYLART